MKLFETSDTVLATYLILEDFTLQDITPRDRQSFFIFKDGPKLKECIKKFNTLQASVEPSRFQQTYRTLIRKVIGK